METDALEKELEGQIIINLYHDHTFSVGTSVDLETTVSCLYAALDGIVEGTMTGIEEMKAFSGKHH